MRNYYNKNNELYILKIQIRNNIDIRLKIGFL